MREIKFRAWDKRDKVIRYSNDTISIAVSDNIVYALDSEPYGNEMTGQWIPLQYTGLHDKNGKEIYEGDILKIYSGEKCEVTFPIGQGFFIDFYDKEKGVGFRRKLYDEVYFDGPSVSIDSRGKISGSSFYDERRPEVIGNIYENPDLLTNSVSKDEV